MRLASYIDSQQSKKAAKLIVKRRRPFGFLLFVVGLVYLCMLPNEELCRKSFFDENALMAGLVRREFSDRRSISRFSDEMNNLPNNEEIFMEWLETRFAELGLEVYSQNFTRTKPVSYSSESNSVSGRNVYGILRAGRALGTESIVLSSPYLSHNLEKNHYGVAVMLALIEYFKTKNYWAKDLVFLVTSGGEIGMQSWIDSYMGLYSAGKMLSSLSGRSGAIQAVINLEVSFPSIQYAEIIADGVNGILPNLDLVNVVVYLCQSERIEPLFYTQHQANKNWQSPSHHYNSLQTMLAVAFRQALGLPLTNHALFLKHRIDSVTIRTVPRPEGRGGSNDLLNLGRALEGTFRSVNNLLETLHHSEFFYFTVSIRHFVSIGLYMPPFGFLIAPIVLEALAQWLLARDPTLSTKSLDDNQKNVVTTPFPFQAVLKLVLVSFTSGLCLCAIPAIVAIFQSPLKADVLIYSLLFVCALSTVVPLLIRTKMRDNEWRMCKAIGLILLLLALVAVSMMNYSLAVFLALALPLPAIFSQPKPSRDTFHFLRMVVTVLFTPPLCLFYFCSIYNFLFKLTPELSLLQVLTEGFRLALEGTIVAYNSWHIVGSWIYFVGCTIVWPLWLISWVLCSSQQEDLVTHEKQHVD